MADVTVRVAGAPQLLRLIAESDAETAAWLRGELVSIAEKVAVDVRGRYAPYSQPGAAGVKPKLTGPGRLLVVQTLRKSRGLRRRKNFGPLMMDRAFLPALDDNRELVDAEAAALLERLRIKWKEEK